MPPHMEARSAPEPSQPPRTKPDRATGRLRVAARPSAGRRSVGDVGTLLALGLFAVCLALAILHAVLVQNQATLDDLIDRNELRQERGDQLRAQIAYLDSPEGLADHATAAGLVPAAELVTLTPVASDMLPPPPADPFGLARTEPAGRTGNGKTPR